MSDARSYLDALYRLVLLYYPDIDTKIIPKKRQKTFGSFADWYVAHGSRHKFQEPLSLLCQLIPWGRTVRGLRNNYIHHAHKGLVYFGEKEKEAYFEINFGIGWSLSNRQRRLPDVFYVRNNPNNLIYLRKLIVYVIAPVCALDQALGEHILNIDGELSKRPSPGAFRPSQNLATLLSENQDMLNPNLYETAYHS
jgi:hypothetical protein